MEIVSREMIKPSSPTPQHLRKHKLSFLDQQAPLTYVSLLFFYDPPSSKNQSIDLSRTLKQSLSRVLTKFYPLAGRILVDDDVQGSYVDCNDEGVEYVETRVHARMADLVDDPHPVDLRKYVWNPSRKIKNPLSIQVSIFDCGGVAVGPCMAHKIGDMASFVMFMNDWSKTARRVRKKVEAFIVGPPDFDVLSSRFPPRPASEVAAVGRNPDGGGAVVASKRFVFEKGMLSELKRVGSSREVGNPTRLEVVTAFLWGSFALARPEKRELVALHVVNVRSPEDGRSFGNGCAPAVARWRRSSGDERVIPAMAAAIRKAKVNVVCDVEGAVRLDGSVKFDCVFSSWCRFPMYSVDYGWGQPRWVATVGEPFKNLTYFMDMKDGEGVEAWVNMVETDMAVVDRNYHRLRDKVMQLPP